MIFKVEAASKGLIHWDRDTDFIEEAQNLSGFGAGICYASAYTPENLNNKYMNMVKNQNRFHQVIQTAHHSISDHAVFSVYLGNISKMLAMLLNSLEVYTTSERSARYTDMSKDIKDPEHLPEVELYNKWKEKLINIIKREYPNLDDKRCTKLAMENARYFLSVFNKTTSMLYTASYRQWSYIAQWISKYVDGRKDSKEYFDIKLCEELLELRDNIINTGVGTEEIVDTKDRKFRFLSYQCFDSSICTTEYIGEMYRMKSKMSLACLAQAHRHRTLKYFCKLDTKSFDVFVPPILSPEECSEWLSDMENVKDKIPQATIVEVIEEGNVEDFILKCKERLCGRAQLEVALDTANKLSRFVKEFTGNPMISELLCNCVNEDGSLKAKCQLIGSCKEPCEFGANGALIRRI